MTVSSAPAAAGPGYISRDGGFPVDIDAAADLGRKPPGDNLFYSDSIYVTGQVTAPGREFAFLAHLLWNPNQAEGGAVRQTLSVTDKATGEYRTHIANVAPGDLLWTSGRLELRTPELSWTGDAQRQKVTATAPWGGVDVDLVVEGPALYYGGTGSWDMLGQRQWQYAFPRMAATGTLTLDGTTYEITGDSWLDRQWGGLPDLRVNRWSWMNFVLPGGDRLAVWDNRPADGEGGLAWAQLLHADGSQELAAMVPLAQDAGGLWTSPGTGQTYPTEFVVRIPSFDTVLTVATVTQAQELPSPPGRPSIYEGAARFTGTYRGVDVVGDIYVEHVGNWNS